MVPAVTPLARKRPIIDILRKGYHGKPLRRHPPHIWRSRTPHRLFRDRPSQKACPGLLVGLPKKPGSEDHWARPCREIRVRVIRWFMCLGNALVSADEASFTRPRAVRPVSNFQARIRTLLVWSAKRFPTDMMNFCKTHVLFSFQGICLSLLGASSTTAA
jgi:hypothetical protein